MISFTQCLVVFYRCLKFPLLRSEQILFRSFTNFFFFFIYPFSDISNSWKTELGSCAKTAVKNHLLGLNRVGEILFAEESF